MTLQAIPRAAVTGYLRLVLWPAEGTLRLLGRGGDNGASSAELRLDRFDAAVREAAGRVLGDEQLRADGALRRVATEERERALRLRSEARRHVWEGEEQLAQRRETTEQQKRQATRRASEQRRQAERERDAKTRQVASTENRRRQATKAAASRKDEAIADRARRARLEQLDKEDEALNKQKQALTSKDEARRLRNAAGSAKAARKRGR